MIIVDTNVVSEAVRLAPDPQVMQWLDGQMRERLHLATPVFAELLFGIMVLPEGERRRSLHAATTGMIALYFELRFLDFDRDAARYNAELKARLRRAGQPLGTIDAQIAAIAMAHGAAVATRDTAPFEAAGVTTINPWMP